MNASVGESFADEARRLDDASSTPREWQKHSYWDGQEGRIVTGPLEKPIEDFSELLIKFGYDPETVEVVGKVNQWRKERPDGTWLTSYFFGIRAKQETVDLPALYAAARRKPRSQTPSPSSDRATVVVFADPQIGKTGRRGGTPELLERIQAKRDLLESRLRKCKPSRLLLADAGDGFENFESGGNPMFTNDLSLAQQMDAYGVELYSFIELMHRFAPVDVAAVPSNHTAWRRGKQQLGNPQDDLGLFVHLQVQRMTEKAGLQATWHLPAPYDESVAVDLLDTRIGLVHGNQFGPGQQVSWWEKQTFGAQAIAAADVLVSGHYHSFSANVAGRNPATGRQRWALGAPTLDNGSDYYRQTAGRDSDPGLLVFDVTPDGFDLGSLVIL